MIDDTSDKTGSNRTKVQTVQSAVPRTFTQLVRGEINLSLSADTCCTSCSSSTHAVAPLRLSNSRHNTFTHVAAGGLVVEVTVSMSQ